jgi:hypothetical protein
MDLTSDDESENLDINQKGPHHRAALDETLKVMRRMLCDAGIQVFQPDFTQSSKSANNKYLWDLAVNLFVELVECGEYVGVNQEICTKEKICQAINSHVTQRLQRQYVSSLGNLSFLAMACSYFSLTPSDIAKKINGMSML